MYINRNGIQFGWGDTYDYTTLGDIMINWLETFKKHGKYGCSDIYLPEREDGHYTDEEIQAGIELMNEEIDQLIWALDDSNSPEVREDMIHLDFNKWSEEMEKYEKERAEKLKLFPKLYQMLWR